MSASKPQSNWHPTPELLKALSSGKLSDLHQLVQLEKHLENCPDCLKLMEQAELDSVQRRLLSLNKTSTILAAGLSRRYELGQVIGHGGSGIVYLANHSGLNRQIAVKKLLRGSWAGRSELARFRRESAALARLSHPNIVQIHDCGEMEGIPFLAMEYIQGTSLAERLHRGPLSAALAARWVQQLADAVAHAHATGVFHRDIKPHNILLSSDQALDQPKRCSSHQNEGQLTRQPKATGNRELSDEAAQESWIPKLVDFGLAQCSDSTRFQTATGETLGTPAYMAPEAIDGRVAPEDLQLVDVYGLGAVLYECLTGRPPFTGSTTLEILDAVANREPASIPSVRTGIPKDLVTICMRCVDKLPERRFSSARQLADDLSRFLDGRPILSRRISSLEKGLRWARRRPALASTLLLAFALLTIVPLLLLAWNRAVQLERNLARQQYASTRAALHEILEELSKDRSEMVPEATRLASRQLAHAVGLFERLDEVDDSIESKLDLGNVRLLAATVSLSLGQLESAILSLDKGENVFQHTRMHSSHQVESLRGLFQVANKRAIVAQAMEDWQTVEIQQKSASDYLRLLQELTPPNDRAQLAHRLMEEQALQHTMGNSSTLSGDFSAAQEYYAKSLDALERLRELVDWGPEEQLTAAGTRINLASAQMQLQEMQLSESNYRLGLAELEAWGSEYSQNSKWMEDWSVGILNQSSLLMKLERPDEAFDSLEQARQKLTRAIRNDPDRLVLKNNLFMVSANRAMFCPFPARKIECWRDAIADASDGNQRVFSRQMLVRVLANDHQPWAAQSELMFVETNDLDDQQRFVQASCHALICKSFEESLENDASQAPEGMAKNAAELAWGILQELSNQLLLTPLRIEHLKTSDDWSAVKRMIGIQNWDSICSSAGS